MLREARLAIAGLLVEKEPRPQGAGARAPLKGNIRKIGRGARCETNYAILMTLRWIVLGLCGRVANYPAYRADHAIDGEAS